MIQKINPTLNLPFASMGQENANNAFQNMGGVVTNSNGTRINSKGLIETVPDNQLRIDYDPVTGECKGLLVEEERTNLVENSTVIGGLSLTSGTTATPDTGVAPDGSQTAYTISGATGFGWSATNCLKFQFIVPTGNDQTYSIYVRSKGVATTVRLGLRENVSSGAVTAAVFTLTTDWKRIDHTISNSKDRIGVILGNTDGDIEIALAQLETGSFPTSYIPTSGTAVTRTADNVSIGGQGFLDFYNQSEGSVLAEVSSSSPSLSTRKIIEFNDGTSNNFITQHIAPNKNFTTVRSISGNIAVLVSSISFQQNTFFKLGTSFSPANNYKKFSNGSLLTVIGLPSMPQGISTLFIGYTDRLADQYLNGHIKSLIYYPVALPDNQMIQLTRND